MKHERLLCTAAFRLNVPPNYDKYMEWGFSDGSVRFYSSDNKKVLLAPSSYPRNLSANRGRLAAGPLRVLACQPTIMRDICRLADAHNCWFRLHDLGVGFSGHWQIRRPPAAG